MQVVDEELSGLESDSHRGEDYGEVFAPAKNSSLSCKLGCYLVMEKPCAR